MRRAPRIRTIALAAAALALALPARAAEPGALGEPADRLYLLAADTDYLHWGTDRDDPELDIATLRWRCLNYPPSAKPCRVGVADGVGLGYVLPFIPGSLPEEPIAWSEDDPLRFRLGLKVDSPLAYSVHVQMLAGEEIETSGPAIQTAPGTWEGTLTRGGPIHPGSPAMFTVFVRTDAPAIDLTLRLRGDSFIELPHPVTIASVPRLLMLDTHRPDPSGIDTPFRSFRFNDREWSLSSFEGTLEETRRFPVSIDRRAVAVFAWIDVFDDPLVHRAIRAQEADPDRLTPAFEFRLLRDGEMVTDGLSAGQMGYGTDSLATLTLDAGSYELEVERSRDIPDSAADYEVHLLAIHGERTLRSYRVTFTPPTRDADPTASLPVAAACPPAIGLVPIPPEVTTLIVDLDWETPIGTPFVRWTPKFEIPGLGEYPCGDLGNGDRVRLTVPAPRITYFGAVPARDATFVSYRDTVLELEVTFSYTPPPPPEEAAGPH